MDELREVSQMFHHLQSQFTGRRHNEGADVFAALPLKEPVQNADDSRADRKMSLAERRCPSA